MQKNHYLDYSGRDKFCPSGQWFLRLYRDKEWLVQGEYMMKSAAVPYTCNKCRVLTPGTCLLDPVKLFSRQGQGPPGGVLTLLRGQQGLVPPVLPANHYRLSAPSATRIYHCCSETCCLNRLVGWNNTGE